MQHEHSLAQTHRVHRPERIASVVRHDFQHSWSKPLERLRGHVLLTALRKVQGVPDFILHTGWERPEHPESVPKPNDRLDRRSSHSVQYAISSMTEQRGR